MIRSRSWRIPKTVFHSSITVLSIFVWRVSVEAHPFAATHMWYVGGNVKLDKDKITYIIYNKHLNFSGILNRIQSTKKNHYGFPFKADFQCIAFGFQTIENFQNHHAQCTYYFINDTLGRSKIKHHSLISYCYLQNWGHLLPLLSGSPIAPRLSSSIF